MAAGLSFAGLLLRLESVLRVFPLKLEFQLPGVDFYLLCSKWDGNTPSESLAFRVFQQTAKDSARSWSRDKFM